MIARLRRLLIPRIQFEQRAFRARLARRMMNAFFLLAAGWLGAQSLQALLIAGDPVSSLMLELAIFVALVTAGIAAHLLLQRGKLIAAGYVLSAAVFSLGASGIFTDPSALVLYSTSLLLATLLSGAIVGGGAAFAFAGLAMLVTALAWLYLRAQLEVAPVSNLPAFAFIHLMTLSVVNLAAASILQALSQQVSWTIERMNNQAVRLANLANTDPLTRLANRRYLIDQLQREYERASRYNRPLSLLYIDLDGFKTINDRFGHLYGDEILRGSAKAMSAVLRSTDLIARIGGDEFAVLMPETDLFAAQNVTSKLRRALSAVSERMGPEVPPLTFCAGVSQLRPDDQSIEEILRRADDAQYLAKATGKDHTRTEEEIASTT